MRCWAGPCLGSRIFAYTLPDRSLPGIPDFRLYCIRCKTETCSSSWIFAYTLQNRSLLKFLDFCVYATEQMPPRASGFLRIRCWTRPCLGSGIFAYTVYAAKQKPARVPEFCVYATEQKTPQVPGFLRTQLGRGLPGLLNFAYTLLGRALPGLLDFCVYCIRCKTEACSSSWIFAYTAGQGPPWDPGFLRIRCWAEPCPAPGFSPILCTLQNRSLLEFLDFCVYAGQGPPRVPEFCVYTAGQSLARAPGFLRIRYRSDS